MIEISIKDLFYLITGAVSFFVFYIILVSDLRTRVSNLELMIKPFWNMIEKSIMPMVKQPTHHGMDELIDKFNSEKHTLSCGDLLELLGIFSYEISTLKKIIQDRGSNGKPNGKEKSLFIAYNFSKMRIEYEIKSRCLKCSKSGCIDRFHPMEPVIYKFISRVKQCIYTLIK